MEMRRKLKKKKNIESKNLYLQVGTNIFLRNKNLLITY